jgi:hypothetical protein
MAIVQPARHFLLQIGFTMPESGMTDTEVIAFLYNSVSVTVAGQQLGTGITINRTAIPHGPPPKGAN